MPILIAIISGLVVGSFLNVCILRLPANESVVFPPSHCFSCRKPIAWFDNVPVLSFLALAGRCRNCQAKISLQYPAIEVLTAALFVLFYMYFGFTAKGVIFLGLTLALLTQALIDAKHQIIPDEITLPGILVGLLLSFVFPQIHGEISSIRGGVGAMLGILFGGGVLYLAGSVTERILKKEAMGGGDVKLLAMIGAFIGLKGVFWTLFVSSLLGSVVGIYQRLTKGQERIPFGPYLGMGAVLYLFFGKMVFDWYWGYLNLR